MAKDTKPTKLSKPPVTHEQFVIAWRDSSSVAEVMQATGLSRQSVTSRAKKLRDAGVKLAKFAPQRAGALSADDVKALNDIVNAPQE